MWPGLLIASLFMVEAVLCDIDGVLRLWNPPDSLEKAHGLPVGTIAATAFTSVRLHPAITGEITDEQWRAAVAVDLAKTCGVERANAVVAEWSELMPQVDTEVVDWLTRVRKIVPVALVSNATTRLEHDLARQNLADIADAVINTARIGVVKPDPRVYRIAAERLGVAVESCLFIDDTPANVDSARELGMTAVLYRDPQQLASILA